MVTPVDFWRTVGLAPLPRAVVRETHEEVGDKVGGVPVGKVCPSHRHPHVCLGQGLQDFVPKHDH